MQGPPGATLAVLRFFGVIVPIVEDTVDYVGERGGTCILSLRRPACVIERRQLIRSYVTFIKRLRCLTAVRASGDGFR